MSSDGYQEPVEKLTAKTVDLHRAITSLVEELEAVDWYQQRADVTTDAELKRILEHNRDEEKEHAAMLIEWLRRNDAGFSDELTKFLMMEGDIVEIEEGD